MKQLFRYLSVKKKLLIVTALLLVSSMIGMAGIAYKMITNYEENSMLHRAEEIADLHGSYIPMELQGVLQNGPDELTEAESRMIGEHLAKIDEEHAILLNLCLMAYSEKDSEYRPIVLSKSTDFPAISSNEMEDGLKEKGSLTFLDSSLGEETAVGLKKLGVGEDSPYVLGIVMTVEDIRVNDWQMASTFIFSMLFIFLLWILFIQKFYNRLLAPIHVLVDGVKKLSEGDFNVHLQKPKEPDFQVLFEQFNYMVKQLKKLFEKLVETSSHIGTAAKDELPIGSFDDAMKEMDNIVYNACLQKELQQAEKMNAIGQLAASVAHEIRNPMTVVKGFLQILDDRHSIGNQEKAYIKLMTDELNRAEGIINEYLSLARPDFQSKEELRLSEFAMHIMELMNGYALMVGNIQLHYHLDIDRPICIYKNEVKQVLINVIKNGMEAMKDGGDLTLTISFEEPYIIFSIKDTGTGMTREQLKRLGTAFYSLKDKGTGMGLMVCYQIMEKMGGKIEVHSEEGVGTTFKVYVPQK